MSIKKLVALTLALLLLASSFAACSNDGGESSADTSKEQSADTSKEQSADTSKEEKEELFAIDIEDFSQYVTLGEYKGVEIVKTVLTDELIEKSLYVLMDSLKEYKDIGTERAAKLGNVVIMDYKGYRKDTGEAFEGGEAKDASLELGSNTFIPGFEDALVGHKAGESFDINVTFPEEYHEETLSGQPVRFAITIKTIKEAVYPEVTDEIAKKLNFETADALKAQARTNAEDAVYKDNLQKAWNKAIEGATIKSYPEELYNYKLDEFVEYYVGYYKYMASMYGMELKDYVGMPEEEFRKDIEKEGKEYVNSYLKEEMIMLSIVDAEFGRELSESELQQKIEEYAKKEGITTEALKEKYHEKDTKTNVLWDKTLVYVYENAVAVEETSMDAENSSAE